MHFQCTIRVFSDNSATARFQTFQTHSSLVRVCGKVRYKKSPRCTQSTLACHLVKDFSCKKRKKSISYFKATALNALVDA